MKKIFKYVFNFLILTALTFGQDYNFSNQWSIYGCMDIKAKNYNSSATKEDGSCIYNIIYGCMDPKAKNYNINATKEDGSCIFDIVYGCMDTMAKNYNFKATSDDGSCEYNVKEKYDIETKLSIFGCTDISAKNYNSSATIEDGSCKYQNVETKNPPIKTFGNNFNNVKEIEKNETSIYPKFKKIEFSTIYPVPGVGLNIYNDKNELLESLLTDSYGKSSFMLDLNKGSGIRVESSDSKYYLVFKEGNYINWDNLDNRALGEAYNFYIYSNIDLVFNIEIADLYTNEIVDNANFESEDISLFVEKKDNVFTLRIPKNELLDKEIQVGDEISVLISTLDINPTKTIDINIDPFKIKKYKTKIARQITKKIQFLDSYNNKPLENIKIEVNGHMKDYFDTTDSDGFLYYKYFGESIGSQISFKANVQYYLELNSQYILDADLSSHPVLINPIYKKIKVMNSTNRDIADNLSFYLDGKIINESIDNDEYKLNFSSIDKDYSILIKDKNKMYEDSNLNLNINYDNVGKSDTFIIHEITSLDFKIFDLESRSLQNGIVLLNDKKIGETNNLGELKYQLKYTDEPINISCLKDGYVNEQYSINLKPGENKQNITLKTITCQLRCYDYKTQRNIENLIIENENIVDYSFDNKTGLYKIQFSDFGDYKLSIFDENDFYQDSDIIISMNKSNIMKKHDLEIFEKTFVVFNVLNEKNQGLNNVEITLDGKLIGDTMKSGKLRKRIKYTKPNIKVKFSVNQYYNLEKEVSVTVGGNNNFDISLSPLPNIELSVVNSEDNQSIDNIVLQINDEEFESDENGKLVIKPDFINQNFQVSFSDGEIDYYNKDLAIIYSDTNLSYDFFLNPVPYLYIQALIKSDEAPLSNADIYLDDQRKGKTRSNGKIKIKVENNGEYILKISKARFVEEIEKIKVSKSRTDIELLVNELEQYIFVNDRMGEPLHNIKIKSNNDEFFTDESGRALINHDYLSTPIELEFVSDRNFHEKLVKEFSFINNFEDHTVIINTRPLKLEIQTIDGLSGKDLSESINGVIEINPRPNTKSTFNLENGLSNIDVYDSGEYKFIFNLLLDKQSIQIEKRIFLDIENDTIQKKIYINKPELLIDSKNIENIRIINLNTKKEYKKDNTNSIILDNYGDYKVEYSIITESNRKFDESTRLSINKSVNELDLIVSNEYVDCIVKKTNNDYDWQLACSNFIDSEDRKGLKQSKDLNYCEILEDLAQDAYTSSDFKISSLYYEKIITSVNECETNPDYHKAYTASLSKITTRNLDSEEFESWNEIEKYWSNNGKISENFDTYNRVCGIIGRNCEKGESELRLTLLASIANLMVQSKMFSDNYFDEEFESICKINQLLFNQVSKYAKNVPYNKKEAFISLIDRNRMDCSE